MTQKGLFDLEAGYVDLNNGIPENYKTIKLNDMKDDQEFQGKPIMGEPYTFDFEDKRTYEIIEKVGCKLALVDTTTETAVLIHFNLKQDGDVQKNIFKGSVLFDFIVSIQELKIPGSMKEVNVFKRLNLKNIRSVLDDFTSITIRVVEVAGEYKFNTLRVIGID